LGKFFRLFTEDGGTSLVGGSIAFSILTIFSLYFLTKEMYGVTAGVIASLLLLSSPLYWFNGEMPLPYVVEGFFSVAFAFACYRTIKGEGKWLLVSAVVLGLAAGVRQSTPFLLLPLWLFSMRRSSLRRIAVSLSVFAMMCLAWYLTMAMLSGGVESYNKAVRAQFSAVVLSPLPFVEEIKIRGKILIKFIIYSLALGIIPFLYYLGRFFRIPLIVRDVRLKFLILWFLPSVIFFVMVNIWNSGHVIIILPPLFIYLAESVKGLGRDLACAWKRLLCGKNTLGRRIRGMASYRAFVSMSTVFLVTANVCFFLLTDTGVSYSEIRNGDSHLSELIRLTRENFPPERTIILTVMSNTQAGYYLRDYLVYCPLPLMFDASQIPIEVQNVYVSFNGQTTPKTYWIPTGFKIEPIDIPDGIDAVVMWEDEIAQYYRNPDRPLQEVGSSSSGSKVYFLRVRPGEKIYYDYHYLTVGHKGAGSDDG